MKKIRTAIIGMGRIGRVHAAEMVKFPDRFEPVAVCDNAPERLCELPEKWENSRKYASLEELLRDPEVELVSIATRHLDHVPMAISVLEAGKFCVVEKPVAASLAEMDRLGECARQHPGRLFLRHNRRFEAAFTKARELIHSGTIGKVHYIKLCRNVGYCRRNDWMTIPEQFGGLLSNWGPHLIDQALQLLESPVADLWAHLSNCISIGASDDFCKIMLRGENGRLAEIEISGVNAMPARELEIVGSRGTMISDGGNKLRLRTVDPAIKFRDLSPHVENPILKYGNFDEVLSFVESQYDLPQISPGDMWKFISDDINGIAPYPVTFAEGREVVRITSEAIRRSGFKALQSFV